jgi:DNA-binding CsgD family transcriptional regulator
MAEKRQRFGRRGETRAALQQRENEVWDRRSKGWTHERIAAELGINRTTVSKIITRVLARLARQTNEMAELWKAEQRARLENQYDECMQRFEASKGRSLAVTRRRTGPTAGQGQSNRAEETVTQHSEDQVGDLRWLVEARATLADLRQLDGLNAPIKTAQTDPTGEHSVDMAYQGMIDELGPLLKHLRSGQYVPPGLEGPPLARPGQPGGAEGQTAEGSFPAGTAVVDSTQPTENREEGGPATDPVADARRSADHPEGQPPAPSPQPPLRDLRRLCVGPTILSGTPG